MSRRSTSSRSRSAPRSDADSDLTSLLAWLAARGLAGGALTPLAGDVSPRRYYRLERPAAPSAIVAAYPPSAVGSCERFLASGELLAAAGVRVPAVLAAEPARGIVVLEDLGTRTLHDLAPPDWRELAPYFERAVRHLLRCAALSPPAVAALNPPLDEALLGRELEQTLALFLRPRRLLGDAAHAVRVEAALSTLCAELGALPPVPCHRDFMVRNLMPLPDGEVGVLDHQDLRLGPPTYDLASLLNDSRFPPPELEQRLLAAALPADCSRLDYARAVVQRTLKAVGTFVSFARRGAARHVPLIAPTLERALDQMRAVPETAPLVPILAPLWRDERWRDHLLD